MDNVNKVYRCLELLTRYINRHPECVDRDLTDLLHMLTDLYSGMGF